MADHLRIKSILLASIAFSLMLSGCSNDKSDEASNLRATIVAQQSQIDQLQGASGASVENKGAEVTPSSQVSAFLTETGEQQDRDPSELVTTRLVNEGMVDLFGTKQKMLIYELSNENNFPVSVAFSVRFYDASGNFMVEDVVAQCLVDELPTMVYTPAKDSVLVTAVSYQAKSPPVSYREMERVVLPGCTVDFTSLTSYLDVPSVAEAYEEVQIADVTLTETKGQYGDVALAATGTLENKGDRDAALTFVQAIGRNSEGIPIFTKTLFHEGRIPAGEKANFTSELYQYYPDSDFDIPSLEIVIGDLSDIASWEFKVASLTGS